MTDQEAIDKAQRELDLSVYLAEVGSNAGMISIHRNRSAWLAPVLRLARIALREQEERENPKPLTIEELKQVDICPVYVVPLDHDYRHYGGWCVFYGGPATAAIPGVDHWDWELVDYGETWIAYRHKPPKGE